jgi:hypothetical protein
LGFRGKEDSSEQLLIDNPVEAVDVLCSETEGLDVAVIFIHHFVGVTVGFADICEVGVLSNLAASSRCPLLLAKTISKQRNKKMELTRMNSL